MSKKEIRRIMSKVKIIKKNDEYSLEYNIGDI